MRKFKLDLPGDELFVLLDLPLLIDCSEEEFDKIADMKPGEQMAAGSYTVERVE